ncbi:MAG TPA: LCCL domain-containing protein, partial [Candidatus Limnocylindrales bacterium]|nr:LCCL domain-containing protein [Candidatus Limnocylindrales bacterium]
TTNAASFRGLLDQEFDFICPPGGQAGIVWGTDVYTDDSSVCTAAVHAGLIDLASGGNVRIVMLAGRDSYEPSTSNGITSLTWGNWGSSFSFVTP